MKLFQRRYPFFRRTVLREQVDEEVNHRVATLLELTADRLFELPKQEGETTQIAGRTVAVTVLREDLPDGSLVIAVCAIPTTGSSLRAVTSLGAVSGFLVTNDGGKRSIPDEILRFYLSDE